MLRDLRYVVRFFHVVPPLPRLLVVTFAVVSAMSAAAISIDSSQVTRTLGPLLLLQLLASSSGFAASARRGYYDLLLTRGHARLQVAVVHWLVSIAPGVVGWIILGIVELLVTRGASGIAFASGTALAMLLLSTIPWALTVALPRFSGAIGWAIVVLMTTALIPDAFWWGPAGVLLFPAVAVGRELTPRDVPIVMPALGIAVTLMAAAWFWIHRTDFALEAAQ